MRLKNTGFICQWIKISALTVSLLLIPPNASSGPGIDDVYTYVSDYWRHAVIVIKNLQIIDDISISADSIVSVDITPDNTRLYATNNRGLSLSMIVVDTKSPNYRKETVIRTEGSPLRIKIHPDGLKAYVSSGRNIFVLDTDPDSQTFNTVVKSVTLPRYIYDMDVSPGGDQLFLICEEGPPGNLFVLDTLEDKLADTDMDPTNGITPLSIGQHVGGSAFFTAIRVGPNGYGYILNTGKASGGYGSGNTISIFDCATFLPVDADNDPTTTTLGEAEGISSITLPGTLPTALAFSHDGGRLYVCQRDTVSDGTSVRGKIILIDADPASPGFNQILRVSEAGVRPEGVGLWPDDRYLFVSCRFEHLIRVFDPSLRVITTIPVNYPGQMVSVKRPKTNRSMKKLSARSFKFIATPQFSLCLPVNGLINYLSLP